MASSFVHLHLHTQFSLLDGANQIEPLVQQIKAFGQPAVAMTDHGNMFGAVQFHQEAVKHGIKPIIGCEMYVAPRSRFDRNAADNRELERTLDPATNPAATAPTAFVNSRRCMRLPPVQGTQEGAAPPPTRWIGGDTRVLHGSELRRLSRRRAGKHTYRILDHSHNPRLQKLHHSM